jgi:hypothetical protein
MNKIYKNPEIKVKKIGKKNQGTKISNIREQKFGK